MGRIGKWLSSKIDTYITGIIESRFNERIQSYLYSSSGDDSPPLDDDKVLLMKVDGTGNYSVCGILSVSQGANPGEKILYSRNSSGTVKATIKLLSSGNIELNGNTNSAVSYSALNTALQSLITALNISLGTKLDGAGTPGTLTLDISASEVSEVKLP